MMFSIIVNLNNLTLSFQIYRVPYIQLCHFLGISCANKDANILVWVSFDPAWWTDSVNAFLLSGTHSQEFIHLSLLLKSLHEDSV